MHAELAKRNAEFTKPTTAADEEKMIGLNLGNTCFVSSVLQCVLHTPAFNGSLKRCGENNHGK